MQLEILHSELLKDFVSAGVALEIDSTVRAGDHLWMEILHLDGNFTFGWKFYFWRNAFGDNVTFGPNPRAAVFNKKNSFNEKWPRLSPGRCL